jgi:CopG family transcriptional regulator / antitoxin EndoAI
MIHAADSKKILISVPINFLEEIDAASHCEHRTRSDFIREALRHYLYNFRKRQLEVPKIDPAIIGQYM